MQALGAMLPQLQGGFLVQGARGSQPAVLFTMYEPICAVTTLPASLRVLQADAGGQLGCSCAVSKGRLPRSGCAVPRGKAAAETVFQEATCTAAVSHELSS